MNYFKEQKRFLVIGIVDFLKIGANLMLFEKQTTGAI
jgi:hypothetical protein